MTLRLAIAGFGKIARDRHLSAIAATAGVELVAIADPQARPGGVPGFASLAELLASGPVLDAVAVCTPPQQRRAEAARALAHGKHVLLEKPPGATVGEMAPLLAAAPAAGCTLFAAWHSRFAPAVEPARAFLAAHPPRAVAVAWKEDVRVWHPGQDWIFEPGGFGVFDPGINALSILTHILPRPFFLTQASLDVPANRDAPVAAALAFADATGLAIRAELDFLHEGPPVWDIAVDTGAGRLTLSQGGARLDLDGAPLAVGPEDEYPALYRHFVDLVARAASDVDLAPLQHAADAFLIGRRVAVAPFHG